ncbi:hypothetical protein ABZ686_06725 [Streptomyces sp. NPDC006992]|uniref:hypothetical protein n=1 Tax=Streptomyces sp. NPDC006992 TaxID=3155601 RepID=UPI003408696B
MLERVVRRGQHDGQFDDRLPADWLVSVVIALAHTASEQADAGRLPPDRAREVLRTSLLRLPRADSGRDEEDGGTGRTGRTGRTGEDAARDG